MFLSICTQTFHADLRCRSVDNGDSTEAESACGDTDVDKSEKEADSVAEVKVEVSETAVEVVDEKVKETIPSSEQGNIHILKAVAISNCWYNNMQKVGNYLQSDFWGSP